MEETIHEENNHWKINNKKQIQTLKNKLVDKDDVMCVVDGRLLMIIFPIDSTFIPVDGFEKISDKMQMIGIIAKLYKNKIRKTMDNSFGLFHWSWWPKISMKIIMHIVIVFVNKSHRIEAPQKIGNFTPLMYCMNFALHSFSYRRAHSWW